MLTAERKLWRAVLEQAYEEAELPSCSGTEYEASEHARARCYLRADTALEAADLDLVCDFADVPCDRLVLWRANAIPSPPDS